MNLKKDRALDNCQNLKRLENSIIPVKKKLKNSGRKALNNEIFQQLH